MPSSRPNIIPNVINVVRQLQPRSILDIGVGFGKWGHLFREYTDILAAERDPARYRKENWQVRIDGIEGHTPYLTPMHAYLYDQIHVGDAAVLIKTLGRYDLVFLGDIIEHFEKHAGIQLLEEARAHSNKAVLLSTPKFETAQEDLCGNELERHRSLWCARDFRRFLHAQVKTVAGSILLVLLPGRELPPVDLGSPRQQDPDNLFRLQSAREEIRKRIAPEDSFILVDEEQLRSTLPHQHATPFLEHDGVYWGAPADDNTALTEFKRLQNSGAKFIVFIWSTFWWLEHYPGFASHLRSHFSTLADNEHLLIFDLQQPSPS